MYFPTRFTVQLKYFKPNCSQLASFDICRSELRQGQYVFDIPTVANSIGVTAAELTNRLQHLKVCCQKSKDVMVTYLISY